MTAKSNECGAANSFRKGEPCERNEKIMMFPSQILRGSLSMGPAAHTKAWGRWERGKQNQTDAAEAP